MLAGVGFCRCRQGTIEAMTKTVEYQGYKIESVPHRLDAEKWRLHIHISVETSRGVLTRHFAVDSIYATEQEADIHGIAYGQRLIDGKVDGQSVMDMKTTDRRATPRLRVQFRTTFSVASSVEGLGIMLDLSTGGCRIESPVTVEAGASLELRIYAPDLEWPLMIEAASVQWVSGQTFGLAFFRISPAEQQRLGDVLINLNTYSE
jgi:hypothetical protein